MAQRTGADSVIAPRSKIASAGLVPALAIALAVAAAGCGSGSGDETASTAAGQAATAGHDAAKATPATKDETPTAVKAAGQASSPVTPGPVRKAGKKGKPVVAPKGRPEEAVSTEQRQQAVVADMALQSPSLAPASTEGPAMLPATYTCEGKDDWPALAWQGVPVGTAELVLFVMNVQPVEGKLFFGWALAGLEPNQKGLEAGRLPKGTVVGRNGFGKAGYSICPAVGSGETYLFALYALPRSLKPQAGFDPRNFRTQVLQVSGNAGLMAVSAAR
jgi:phosphatidylethanolamine-binding protein (PEBP) family uncharacterized protein